MQLYSGNSVRFVEDTLQGRVAEKLKIAYYDHYRHEAPASEIWAWQNSLRAMCDVIQGAGLSDQGILLEYMLPLTSRRLDCMITGRDKTSKARSVIVELKQWDKVVASEVDDCVVTFIGGRLRDMLHPSRQASQYQQYLEDCSTAFHPGYVTLDSCSYLHNMRMASAIELLNPRYEDLLEHHPLFTGDMTQDLIDYLAERVSGGDGHDVLDTVIQSQYRPNKKLMEHTAEMVRGQKEFVLLDEQLVVFNSVLTQVRKGVHRAKKAVVLVKGGPGTGKSVIALNIVGELSAQGYNVQHATGSRAFTGNIRKLVGSRAGVQFKYFNSFLDVDRDAIDILVMDESHRMREYSHNRYTPRAKRTNKPQVQELVDAARVCVFFIDDLQVVRPGELGSSDLIRDTAASLGADLYEYELETQFRCGGSEGFINWVDNTLGIRQTENVLWESDDQFEFKIMDSVQELEAKIREKQDHGFTARLTAGFCWPWSDPMPDGQLISDVDLGEWSMPWNAKPDAGRLAKGIPKADFWALDPNGIDQVGCIYTAQGFEYDYCGVIFGLDLRYDPVQKVWIGDRAHSEDTVVKRAGDSFVNLVKQTYRVLLTRGMRGCYVYFQDDATRKFVLDCITAT